MCLGLTKDDDDDDDGDDDKSHDDKDEHEEDDQDDHDHNDSFVGKISPFCQAAVYPRPSKAHAGDRESPLAPKNAQWSGATDAL